MNHTFIESINQSLNHLFIQSFFLTINQSLSPFLYVSFLFDIFSHNSIFHILYLRSDLLLLSFIFFLLFNILTLTTMFHTPIPNIIFTLLSTYFYLLFSSHPSTYPIIIFSMSRLHEFPVNYG